ncbi:MAG TPA: hypothetical protein VF528_12260 [Pyrinomonadaceae bacterium]|jgi:uncharacterized protein YaaN involved in tellurite resistance
MMSDDELQLNAQERVQEFDDAVEIPNSDLNGLGKKAVEALDAFIVHWNDKPQMQRQDADTSEGEQADLRRYAERQIEWATNEKERIVGLLPKPGGV